MTFLCRHIDDPGQLIGRSLLDGQLELPRLAVRTAALDHNIDAMARYCQAHQVSIAPHVKTTMAPAIIERQLAAGAWGVTVATVDQLRTCLELGAGRILLANELVDPAAAAWLGRALAERPNQEVYCLVDSAAGAERLARGWHASGNQSPLAVLVELGVPGARAGCRSAKEVRAVAEAINRLPALSVVGVEGFEGVLGSDRAPETIARVDQFLQTMVVCARQLVAHRLVDDRTELLLTAGGSRYFDRVADCFGSATLGVPSRVVLRSGSYVAHDHSLAEGYPTLDGVPLEPALELWADVLSVPEPGRAIAGFGRRDAPFDAGLPVALGRFPAADGDAGEATEGEWREYQSLAGVRVSALNDQHAYLDAGTGQLAVGDRMVFGIIHPCTAFDKWRQVLLVDDDHIVLDVFDTRF